MKVVIILLIIIIYLLWFGIGMLHAIANNRKKITENFGHQVKIQLMLDILFWPLLTLSFIFSGLYSLFVHFSKK